MDRRYHTLDAKVNAERMLADLDELYYGVCRLHHDFKGKDDNGLGWDGMTEVTRPIAEAARALMKRYPTIATQTFNREWFEARGA